ncbi:TPA: hypothetical protein ACIJ22_006280 [Pseudomonas aeruginosa]
MKTKDDDDRFKSWRKAEAAYEATFAERKASEYHIRCRDCGVFVSKRRWVKKDHFNAIQHQQRPLCARCFDEYD